MTEAIGARRLARNLLLHGADPRKDNLELSSAVGAGVCVTRTRDAPSSQPPSAPGVGSMHTAWTPLSGQERSDSLDGA